MTWSLTTNTVRADLWTDGSDWLWIPLDIANHYRAEGYRSGIKELEKLLNRKGVPPNEQTDINSRSI